MRSDNLKNLPIKVIPCGRIFFLSIYSGFEEKCSVDEKIKRRIAAPPYFLYINEITRISETNIGILFRKSKALSTFLKNRVKVHLKLEFLCWSDIFTFRCI